MAYPRRKTKVQFFYHVSTKNMGTRVVLSPRQNRIFFTACEPVFPRICVAPTVPHCLSALDITYLDTSFLYVYRTLRPVRAMFPIQQEFVSLKKKEKRRFSAPASWYSNTILKVCDVDITKEKWLLEPRTFTQTVVIDRIETTDVMFEREHKPYVPQQEQELEFYQEMFNNDGSVSKRGEKMLQEVLKLRSA